MIAKFFHIFPVNPTPPERVDIKKARSEPFDSLSDSETNSSNNNEMADAIEFVQPLLSQKMSITMSLLYRGRLIIGHLIYCQFTFNVTKMNTPNKSMCIQNVNRINGGHILRKIRTFRFSV
jgi:hypothetical protein